MNTQQISILNSLVTFAAENVPGGLSEEEQEVAKMVGSWVLEPDKTTRIRYRPIFVGKTKDDEKIVVYMNVDNYRELHIKRPDGQLWALGPGSEVNWMHEPYRGFSTNIVHIQLKSEAWTGEALGDPVLLVEEPPIRFF